jgi:carbamoyl-phosphate synthase large subunit
MEVCYDEPSLVDYMTRAVTVTPDIQTRPVLIDEYLSQAVEIDVDAVTDGVDVIIGGVLEHIEEAGVHSGDSAMATPPHSVSPATVAAIEAETRALARELGVVGLMNVQYAIQGGEVYILEVNPRASRTVPFLSKAHGLPLAKVAAKVMAGRTLKDLGITENPRSRHVAVKESVFPFVKFPHADPILGPEMKSTGEVMGIDRRFDLAFAKACLGAGVILPESGRVFISVSDQDKPQMVSIAQRLVKVGFELIATGGTAAYLEERGLPVRWIKKVYEGRPHIVDAIVNGEVALVFNTTVGKQAIKDSFSIRRQALMSRVPYFTTASAAAAVVGAIEALGTGELEPGALQDYQRDPS